MPKTLRWLAAALATTVILPAAATAETWGEDVNEKVFPNTVRPADAETGVSIAAARDEYEGGFAVVRSASGLTVTPSISDLVGPGTIPAANVELFRVEYIQLQTRSTGVDRHEAGGRYPDPLQPINGPIVIPPNETTAIYVLVHVPSDAAPGSYSGTLDLGSEGQVPVSVEVAPVTASRDQYTMVARFNQVALSKALGVPERDPRLVEGVYGSLLPMLRARGINPGKAPYSTPKIDPATWAVDYADPPPTATGTVNRNTNLERFLAMGFPAVEVPFLPNFPAAGGEDRQYRADAKRRTAAAGFAARFAGVASRTFALPVDEPNPKTYDDLQRAAAQLRSADPKIPVLVTEAPHPEALAKLGASTDIWVPPIWDFFKIPQGIKSVRQQGKRVWWYTYGSDTQRYTPNVLIDKPTSEARAMAWLAAREGVEGFFYWGLNNWGGKRYHSPWDNPWYKSHTSFKNTCGGGPREIGGNGEASLIYPTTDPRNPAIPSLRLEALRDGAEDYSLLRQLQGADPALYRKLADGIATPYAGRSEGGKRTGCDDEHRPGYLPVVETDADAIRGARLAMLARFSGKALPTLAGKVAFAGKARGGAIAPANALAGKPVEGAVVRFGTFSTVTDRKGRWTLSNVSPAGGTVSVSRDHDGDVGGVALDVAAETLEGGGLIPISTPPIPHRPSKSLIESGGLVKWSGRIAPARARARGNTITATVGRRYHRNGDEVRHRGGVAPTVESLYPRGPGGKKLRNWSRYRYLDFTVEVLRRPPANQKFHLIVTPGHYLNASKMAAGHRKQYLRLPLKGMRNLRDVRYLRFGVQSAVPKPWRGGHDLKVKLRIRNLRLVK